MKNVLAGILLLALAVSLRAETPAVRLGGTAVLRAGMAAELAAASGEVGLQVVPDCERSDIMDLVKGRVDLVLMPRYLTAEEIKTAKQSGQVLHPFTFAYEGIAVVADKKNPLKKLSRAEVRDIIGGKITVWEELGVSGGEMRGYLQEDGVVLREPDMSVIEPALREGLNITRLPRNIALIGGDQLPQAVGGHPDAFGFVGVSRLRDAKEVKIIPVDGLLPTLPAVQGRSYPYIQGIYIYTRGLPSGEIKQAVNYLTGSAARKILGKYGMVSGNN
ncbi:MAG: substrate-binding domain-containing protein [Verrucomicrobiales bacterium]|jgi:phosphate transport system substrate-binding protein|nr:substrate-binding domain-containing protein [Verrucomicrobiales bacterium]